MGRALALLLCLGTSAGYAAEGDVGELQRALGGLGTVVDGARYDLPDGGRVTLGRYRERPDSDALLPIALAPAKCAARSDDGCAHVVHLGQAARRIGVIALVDLDIDGDIPLNVEWRGTRVRGSAKTNPALVLAVEREGKGALTEVVIVALRPDSAFDSRVVLEYTLEERYPEPTGARAPATRLAGKAMTSLAIAERGRELRTTIQPIDAPSNPCKPTRPYSKVFELANGAYRDKAGTVPSRPCE